jgi:hypothetical protein
MITLALLPYTVLFAIGTFMPNRNWLIGWVLIGGLYVAYGWSELLSAEPSGFSFFASRYVVILITAGFIGGLAVHALRFSPWPLTPRMHALLVISLWFLPMAVSIAYLMN